MTSRCRATHSLPGLIAFFLLILAAAGCTGNDESRVGASLLPDTVDSTAVLRETVFAGDSLETDYQFEDQLVGGGLSPTIVLSHEMGHTSRALIRFGVIPLDADTALQDAEITLVVHETNPAGAMPHILAYQLLQSFSGSFDGEDVFPAFIPEPLTEGIPGKAPGETEGDSLDVYRFGGEAVTDLFRRWLQGTVVNAGLLLTLAPEDTGRVSFDARDASSSPVDLRPAVRLIHGDAADPDTLLRLLPDEDTFLVTRPPGTTLAGVTGRLTISSGLAGRSLLLFPVHPSLGQTIVHHAELVISIDLAASRFDSLAMEAELAVDFPWIGTDTRANLDVDGRGTAIPGVDTVAIDVTDLVREWVIGVENNTGVRLRVTNEGFGFDWIRFYDSTAADSLRPRLRVVYGPTPAEVEP